MWCQWHAGELCWPSRTLHQNLLSNAVAFNIYDMDGDGLVSADELFQTLRMLMGRAMTDAQLGDIVDSTVMAHDHDADGKLSLQEFTAMLAASEQTQKAAIAF